MHVAVMESLGISPEELARLEQPFAAKGVTFSHFDRTSDPEALVQEAKDADVMILANMPMSGEVLRRCPKLRFIDVAFTGVDHVGLDAAREKGIAVSNASGYSNEAVAELTVGAVLSLARNLRQTEERCRTGGTKDGLVGWEIRGKTLGIIGLGKIGTRTAELFHAFGAEILAASRTHHGDAPDYIRQVSVDEVLEKSDIVALHCPLNDSTRGLIDSHALAKMKPTAILVNMARGPVVVSRDLAEALKSGIIAGAAVDVFDKEPPLGSTEPLLTAPKCLLTPHIAFATQQSMGLRAEIVFDNLAKWMDGNQINVIL